MPATRTVPVNGDTVRALRLKSGLTQYDLSDYAKVAQSHISDIERGEAPSELVANRIANALAVPLAAILRSDPAEIGEAS